MTLREIVNKSLLEEIKPINGKGIIVFDIDDTLIHADASNIGIWKEEPGKQPIRLSTDQYAKDPDAATHKDWFNYKEFNDPKKVYNSIVNGTPLLRNLRMMDAYIRAGYEMSFLTARGLEKVVAKALGDFLLTRLTKGGKLEKIPNNIFRVDLSAGVNDDEKKYPGNSDGEKKANVLKSICSKYDKVVFVDDDKKNLKACRALNLPNLQVVAAQGNKQL